MGYTHYWKFNGEKAPVDFKDGAEKFAKAANLGARLCDKVREMGIEICGGDGHSTPTFSEGKIVFNGCADKGEACETFSIHSNDGSWDFCKTEEKPYDLLVCLMLLAFKHFFGEDFTYNSDGINKLKLMDAEYQAYWKKIGFVPNGVDRGWAKAYEVWEEVKKKQGLK